MKFNENQYKKETRDAFLEAKIRKGSERYFMFGPNHILVTMRWDDGRSSVCSWYLNRYK